MLDGQALDTLFRSARTHHAFIDKPVSDAQLKELWALVRMAPTTANTQPMRLVFVRSIEGKERLISTLRPPNVEQTRQAPVTAIVAYDLRFYDFMHKTLPEMPEMAERYKGDAAKALVELTCLRNGSIQGGYLMVAARALGLDYGAMTGYDNEKLDALFFPDGRWKSNFLCNLGYGDASKLASRHIRLSFDETCRFA